MVGSTTNDYHETIGLAAISDHSYPASYAEVDMRPALAIGKFEAENLENDESSKMALAVCDR